MYCIIATAEILLLRLEDLYHFKLGFDLPKRQKI